MNTAGHQHRYLCCEALLQRSGWLSPAYVELDAQGLIVAVSPSANTQVSDWEEIPGYVIPGFQNGHSHAFQYLMAGLAEHSPRGGAGDDFWAWREAMYHYALKVAPEHMQAVAAMVYAEMVRHGYTAVAEFHYLHHDEHGRSYSDPAEMSRRLMAAAEEAGIHLTLVPVLYQRNGFAKAATPQQRRFIHAGVDEYLNLLTSVRKAAAKLRDISVGRGIHSLRAVAPREVMQVLGGPFSGPAHIHVAEQPSEVDQCVQATGLRPVAWLLQNLPLDRRFTLVHATHMDPGEVRDLAASDATVVVTPGTEGNLGDGLFPLKDYWRCGGRVAIGSDSQVTLSPLEELRWLDYGQRLHYLKRQVLDVGPGSDFGAQLFDAAWTRGRYAMGQSATDYFAVGACFDAAVIDPAHPAIYGKAAAHRLSALIYSGHSDCLIGTMRRGQWLARFGRHLGRDAIRREYHQAIDSMHLHRQP